MFCTVNIDVVDVVKADMWMKGRQLVAGSRNELVSLAFKILASRWEGEKEWDELDAQAYMDREYPVASVKLGKRVKSKRVQELGMELDGPVQGEVNAGEGGTWLGDDLGFATEEEVRKWREISEAMVKFGKEPDSLEDHVRTVRENRRKAALQRRQEALGDARAGEYKSEYVRQEEWAKGSGGPMSVSVGKEEKEELERRKREILDEIGGGDKSQALRDMLNEVVAKLEEVKKVEMREGLGKLPGVEEQLG